MGIELYEPAPILPDESRREKAVETSGALQATRDPGLEAIVMEARRDFGTAMAAISIVYKDWQYLIATAGLPGGPYSRRASFCGHAIHSPRLTFCIADALRDARFANNPLVSDGMLRFYAGARLLDANDLALGSLCLLDPQPRVALQAAEQVRLALLAQAVMARLQELNRAG